MNITRILAIDYGTRRIGLALGDDVTRLAGPLDRLEGLSDARAVERIAAIVGAESVGLIVVGLPLHMDGSSSAQTKRTVGFARALAGAVNVPVVCVDERLSSFSAEQNLLEQRRAGQKLTRGQKRSRIDALAATHILQAYLDGQAKAIAIDDPAISTVAPGERG